MTRPRHEIMRDLHAILAELDYVMHGNDTAGGSVMPGNDISPKLAKALDVSRETHATPPPVSQRPIESHEDIRAKARAYRPTNYIGDIPRGSHITIQPDEINRPDKPERLADYTPADDPEWDEAVFMGTGDQRAD